MRTKLIFLVLLPALCINNITAQPSSKKFTITGTVLDVDKKPIVSAIVMINGEKTNTITDEKGNFRIRVDSTASKIGIFTFSCGVSEENIYGRKRIDFDFNTSVDRKQFERSAGITLPNNRKVIPGEESVDIGYAHIKKKDLTTDIDFIDGTNKKYASYSSVAEMIIREVSGVRLLGGQIIIQNAVNLGGAVPLLIRVDGTTGSLNDIRPSEVKSISILKGTAAAIYGSRGYGGAIIIKTKTYDEW